jgi:hypothetical protein
LPGLAIGPHFGMTKKVATEETYIVPARSGIFEYVISGSTHIWRNQLPQKLPIVEPSEDIASHDAAYLPSYGGYMDSSSMASW